MSIFHKNTSEQPQEQPQEQEPEQETINNDHYDSPIKPVPPKKAKSRFKRGKLVLCMLISPGQKQAEFKNLLKEENVLSDKHENQKFLIVEPPSLISTVKDKSYPVYVCDTEKGVTIGLSYDREQKLASMYCDPHMLSNILDETFISKASNIKADWKQLVGVGCGGLVFGAMLGLLF